jgi:uroporphyrinogen-III synthase
LKDKALVTIISPRPLGAALLAGAAARGILVREIELLSFEYPPVPGLSDLLESLDCPLVFTSRHAVRALGQRAGGRRCYAIGGATAGELERLGAVVAGKAGSAGALARTILEDKPERVLFLSGNIRRSELLDTLTAGAVEVIERVVYHKTLRPVKVEEPYDGVLFFSGSQADAFLRVNRLSPETPAFCIGATTAAHLAAKGHPLILQASEPHPASVMDIAFQYFQK